MTWWGKVTRKGFRLLIELLSIELFRETVVRKKNRQFIKFVWLIKVYEYVF